MFGIGVSSNNSQLTHFQKYKVEYQGFLDRLEGNESIDDVTWLKEILLQYNPGEEELSTFFQKMVELHAAELRRIASTDGDSLSPLDMKRIERLDRLTFRTSMTLGAAIHDYILEKVCMVNPGDLSQNAHSSYNSTFFILPQEWGSKVGLFKPSTKGKAPPFPGVSNEEAFVKQVSAFLISRLNGGRSDVPLSMICSDESTNGSFQTFRKSWGDLTDVSFSTRSELPIDAMHFATIFRGRLYDLDAHDENILFKEKDGEFRLTHIDLDYILPNFLCDASRDIRMKISWVFFPQLDKPFSENVLGYLNNLDSDSEIKSLARGMLKPESRELLRATTFAFKKGAELGLTPGAILDFLDSKEFRYGFIGMLELAGKCNSDKPHSIMKWFKEVEIGSWKAESLLRILSDQETDNSIQNMYSELKGLYLSDIGGYESSEVNQIFFTIASLLIENPEIRRNLCLALQSREQINSFIKNSLGHALRELIKENFYDQVLVEGLDPLKIEFDDMTEDVNSMIQKIKENPRDVEVLKNLEKSFEDLICRGILGRRFAVILAREVLNLGIPDKTICEMINQLKYHSANTVSSEIYSVQAIQETLNFVGKNELALELDSWYRS